MGSEKQGALGTLAAGPSPANISTAASTAKLWPIVERTGALGFPQRRKRRGTFECRRSSWAAEGSLKRSISQSSLRTTTWLGMGLELRTRTCTWAPPREDRAAFFVFDFVCL